VFFIPTILRGFGYTVEKAQVMSIPIYLGAVVVVLITAQISDRLQHRYGFILFGVLLGIIGYSLLLAPGLSYRIQYMAVYFSTIGFYTAEPMIVTWAMNNWAGHWKRCISSGIFTGIGTISGLIASNIYPSKDGPRFVKGYSITLGGLVLLGMTATVFFVGLKMENRRRRQGKRDYRYDLPSRQLENMGDAHPNFRFSY
jgi:MFS family permease